MTEIEIDIESEKENKLLNRRELTLRVYHKGQPTPTRKTVRTKVAELTGFNKEQVIIESINSEFGRDEANIIAKLYNDKDDAFKYERKHILLRNELKR